MFNLFNSLHGLGHSSLLALILVPSCLLGIHSTNMRVYLGQVESQTGSQVTTWVALDWVSDVPRVQDLRRHPRLGSAQLRIGA